MTLLLIAWSVDEGLESLVQSQCLKPHSHGNIRWEQLRMHGHTEFRNAINTTFSLRQWTTKNTCRSCPVFFHASLLSRFFFQANSKAERLYASLNVKLRPQSPRSPMVSLWDTYVFICQRTGLCVHAHTSISREHWNLFTDGTDIDYHCLPHHYFDPIMRIITF